MFSSVRHFWSWVPGFHAIPSPLFPRKQAQMHENVLVGNFLLRHPFGGFSWKKHYVRVIRRHLPGRSGRKLVFAVAADRFATGLSLPLAAVCKRIRHRAEQQKTTEYKELYKNENWWEAQVFCSFGQSRWSMIMSATLTVRERRIC